MIEILLSLGAAAFLARGMLQALRGAPKASTWFAGASAMLIGLATRFPQNFEVTAVVLIASMSGLSVAAMLFIRERIGAAEQREVSASADAAEVIGLLEAAEEDERAEGGEQA